MEPSVDITIIIPSFNRLWCLPETIESCRNTNCATEIIVIDDGSIDGTQEWLAEQEGIIVLKQQHLGKCWAVNKGMAVAKGKYIRFLDSDDMLAEGANDEQFILAESLAADVVVSGYTTFAEAGQMVSINPWTVTDDFISRQLGEGDGSHYSAFLFKKEFIIDIPHRPDFEFRDDRLFILEVALKDPQIAVHPGVALKHRVAHHDRLQVSEGIKQQVQNFQLLNIYKRIIGQLENENRLTERRIDASLNVLWNLCMWIAYHDIKQADGLRQWINQLKPAFKPQGKGMKNLMYNNLGFKTASKILRVGRSLKYGIN